MMLKRSVLLIFLALCWPSAAPAQDQQGSIFTVTDVPVDATAQSAVQARDKARLEGQQKAFHMLIDRLAAKQDQGKVPKLSDDQLTDLVQDFEVTSERTSAVRYIGTLTYRFRPDAVRKLLNDANISFTETRAKTLLVLPVFEQEDRSTLWDAPNPWRAAWGRQPLGNGVMPLRMPLGELPDVQAIDAAEAIKGQSAPLLAIGRRYDNDDVLVSDAVLSGTGDQRTLQITTVQYGAGFALQTWRGTVHAKPGERDADLYARGVTEVVTALSDSWSTKSAQPSAGPGSSMVAMVPLSNLRDWLVVRERLRTVSTIHNETLLSIGHDGARVQLDYSGDPNQLQTALAQRDLVLTPGGSGADWTLSAKGASGQ